MSSVVVELTVVDGVLEVVLQVRVAADVERYIVLESDRSCPNSSARCRRGQNHRNVLEEQTVHARRALC